MRDLVRPRLHRYSLNDRTSCYFIPRRLLADGHPMGRGLARHYAYVGRVDDMNKLSFPEAGAGCRLAQSERV